MAASVLTLLRRARLNDFELNHVSGVICEAVAVGRAAGVPVDQIPRVAYLRNLALADEDGSFKEAADNPFDPYARRFPTYAAYWQHLSINGEALTSEIADIAAKLDSCDIDRITFYHDLLNPDYLRQNERAHLFWDVLLDFEIPLIYARGVSEPPITLPSGEESTLSITLSLGALAREHATRAGQMRIDV